MCNIKGDFNCRTAHYIQDKLGHRTKRAGGWWEMIGFHGDAKKIFLLGIDQTTFGQNWQTGDIKSHEH